jgi:hypothetical protein
MQTTRKQEQPAHQNMIHLQLPVLLVPAQHQHVMFHHLHTLPFLPHHLPSNPQAKVTPFILLQLN